MPHAPVSMPVTWAELPDVDPADFTIRTVPQVLASRPHAWAGMDEAVGTWTARWRCGTPMSSAGWGS